MKNYGAHREDGHRRADRTGSCDARPGPRLKGRNLLLPLVILILTAWLPASTPRVMLAQDQESDAQAPAVQAQAPDVNPPAPPEQVSDVNPPAVQEQASDVNPPAPQAKVPDALARAAPAQPVVRARILIPMVMKNGWWRKVGPVRFSQQHGLFDKPFGLQLDCPTPAAGIRFTLDGSLPTETHGFSYTGPLRIDRTSIVRAVAYQAGAEPSAVGTETFIFPAGVAGQTDDLAFGLGWPRTWGIVLEPGPDWGHVVHADYGLRPDVLAGYSEALPGALRALPSMSLVMAPEDLYGDTHGLYVHPQEKGPEWVEPASVEFMPADNRPGVGFQAAADVRLSGGWSRKPDSQPKHSFNLNFMTADGAGPLRYPLFPDTSVTQFRTLRLRGGQADSFAYFAHKAQYLHDQWGRDTQRDMGWPSAHGRFVHLYINGLYWGVYNVTEEITAAFMSSYLGGNRSEWDVLKDGDLVNGTWSTDVEDGQPDAFNQLIARVQSNPTPDPRDKAAYEAVAAELNIGQHIDYLLTEIYMANFDWPLKNWRAARNRVSGGGFQYFIWDTEHTTALRDDAVRGLCISRTDPLTGQCGFNADTAGVQGLHHWLWNFQEYRLAFADRVERHFFASDPAHPSDEAHTGALTAAATLRRYEARAEQLDQAIVAESARWGFATPPARNAVENGKAWEAYRRNYPYAGSQTQEHWRLERGRLETEYYPNRTAIVLQQLCDQTLYSPILAPRLHLVGGGGGQPAYLMANLGSAANGCQGALPGDAVFVTLDGSDPRMPWTGDPDVRWSGSPSINARKFLGPPVKLPGYAHIRARTALRHGDTWLWSALAELDVGRPRIGVSEIMYHPPEGDSGEFLELVNLEGVAVDLSGLKVTKAVTYTAPQDTVLPPGGHLVLVRDAQAFAKKYPGVAIGGSFQGKLDNNGETIRLTGADGLLEEFEYRPDGLWPLNADGQGYSLVPLSPDGRPSDPESWRASTHVGGSPGADDPPNDLVPVVVNEVLANARDPFEEAVELHNLSPRMANLAGWYLSDDPAVPKKFRLPPLTTIAPGGYRVFYERDLAGGAGGFHLSPSGGRVVLSSGNADGDLTGYMRGADYGASDEGVSLGRVPTSAGVDFVALDHRTFGADNPATVSAFRRGGGLPNAPALVGPVVMNELMPNPPAGGDEYIELLNITDQPVPLFDPLAPERVWAIMDGVRFSFPRGVTLAPGGYALVVGTTADAFRRKVRVPPEVPVFGPFEGKLKNEGERVVLSKPGFLGAEGEAGVPIDVDAVRYADGPPWPPRLTARAAGLALERVQAGAYGNEPANWQAFTAGGTPGRANTTVRRVFLPKLEAGE